MKTTLKISDSSLRWNTKELNRLLADEIVLFITNKNYYWNIEVENFCEMRQFYQCQTNQLEKIIEMVAEHIRISGGQTEKKLNDYLNITNLIEHSYTSFTREQLKYMLASHETIINNLRRLICIFSDNSEHIVIRSFISKILIEHEKMARMIRSYLKRLPLKKC